MKKLHSFCIMAMIAICVCSCITTKMQKSKNNFAGGYDGYAAEFAADTMTIKEEIPLAQEVGIVFEQETFYLGTLSRSDSPLIKHLLCKCKENNDVRINQIKTTSPCARVSASPLISAGSEGTILYIIDTKLLKLGSYTDTISIQTNSHIQSDVSVYIKYSVEADKK